LTKAGLHATQAHRSALRIGVQARTMNEPDDGLHPAPHRDSYYGSRWIVTPGPPETAFTFPEQHARPISYHTSAGIPAPAAMTQSEILRSNYLLGQVVDDVRNLPYLLSLFAEVQHSLGNFPDAVTDPCHTGNGFFHRPLTLFTFSLGLLGRSAEISCLLHGLNGSLLDFFQCRGRFGDRRRLA